MSTAENPSAQTAPKSSRDVSEIPLHSKFSNMLGITTVTCTAEEVTCQMTVTEDMLNRNGVLHGGALMTLADTTAGTAAFLGIPVDITNVTIEAKTNFIRPVTLGDTVTATCEPVHIGRASPVFQVKLTRGDGKTVGVTTQTHMVIDWAKQTEAAK